jgi:hypothetical protein
LIDRERRAPVARGAGYGFAARLRFDAQRFRVVV